MVIDHESHRIRIKAVSDKLGHPMTYNDAGAPRENASKAGNEMSKKKIDAEKMNRDREYVVGGR